MIRMLARPLVIALALVASACSDSPNDPSPGTPGLAIAPQPDFLTVGTSILLEARLTTGTAPPRVVQADWSSTDGRVVSVERTGRINALGPGRTTIRAAFEQQTASLDVRVTPDFNGTWTGTRRVRACNHPRPDFCAANYLPNTQVPTTLVLTQSRDRVTGTLSFAPPLSSPYSAVAGSISEVGILAVDGTIVSAPATGASITLGTLGNWQSQIEPATGVQRGSFVEARVDADGTAWNVNWEITSLTRVR
jgi:hypothetical protein